MKHCTVFSRKIQSSRVEGTRSEHNRTTGMMRVFAVCWGSARALTTSSCWEASARFQMHPELSGKTPHLRQLVVVENELPQHWSATQGRDGCCVAQQVLPQTQRPQPCRAPAISCHSLWSLGLSRHRHNWFGEAGLRQQCWCSVRGSGGGRAHRTAPIFVAPALAIDWLSGPTPARQYRLNDKIR